MQFVSCALEDHNPVRKLIYLRGNVFSVYCQQVLLEVLMGCPLCQEPLRLCLLVLTLQWVLPRQEHPCLCMCPQAGPFHLECPLPLDPWEAQTDVIIPREHPPECLLLVCPLCRVWEARHPTDFHPRWECRQTGCIRRLIQVGALLSELFSYDP